MSSELEVHEGVMEIGAIANVGEAASAGVLTLRFVHYPGAQQLILWLPQSGHQGYGDVTLLREGKVIERATVRSRLNGSVQILWDTLSWPPGDYLISITHDGGWRHEARLRKLEAGVAPPQPEPPPPPPPAERSEPIVYRDGFGNVIPNVDLEIRAKALRDVARKFARHLEYEGNYRAGTIHYVDGERRISFGHEMCGGDLKFAIDIPTVDQWESRTGTPLSERDDILTFVAMRVQQEQASSWRYRITENSIDFY